MPFTYSQAITRLSGGARSAFVVGLTNEQKMQRINEVLDRFYELGTWSGVLTTIGALITTGGVLSLPSDYLRIDALAIPESNDIVPLRSQEWQFSEAGPGLQDWTKYGEMVAIDIGDVNGIRKYQITGDPAKIDAYSFSALARKRYAWVTDTSATVIPDSYQALRLGVIAMGWEDEGDDARYQQMFGNALQVLNGNYDQSESDTEHGVVSVEIATSMGMIPNLN